MTLPFDSKIKFIPYMFMWIIYALLHTVSIYQLVEIPFWSVFLDGFIHAVLFAIIGVLLWNVLQYGKFSSLPFIQQLVNSSALGILSIGLWIGTGFLIEYICFNPLIIKSLVYTLPLKVFLGLLIYLIIILTFKPEVQSEKQEDILTPEKDPALSAPEEFIEKEILERIAVKIGQKIHVVPISDILYFQSYGDYVQIITEKEKYIKEQTMKYFEANLPQHQFVRVHRSYIVNVEAISRIESHVKQSQLIILKNSDQLKVSVAGYKILRSVLNL